MKYSPKIYFLLILIFLAGCATTPSRLGIPQSEWDQYSPDKKDQLLSDYEQTQKRKKAHSARSGSGVLSVEIQAGKALLPPYTTLVAYQPITFTIRQGNCHKTITVEADHTDQKGKLEACYQNNILYLDPSPYNPDFSLGSLQLPDMPIWKRGYTYHHVTSSGLLKLTDVNISLRQLAGSS